ncbi:MAG: Gfo/Idh/MocA family oxidoreductase [Bacteroidales bacterium]|jgi:virulence factor|nr:Gfo/Idh/MocA family oxidoreductase [Bacteroidales bacterium]
MDNIIEYLRKIRKQAQIKSKYRAKYAFVGVGNHSINNLYPIIDYLHIPLKYILTKTPETAKIINKNNCFIEVTTNFEKVLNDSEIKGIFISASPKSHYELVKKTLQNNKNVYVEKPPCLSILELLDLIETENKTNNFCVVGLQKRYSECTKILSRKLKLPNVISYNYRFLVGDYPEGDNIFDLFIHPLDLVCYLFGNYKIISMAKTNFNNDSVFLQIRHNNIIGNIELSTQYSWKTPLEHLIINTNSGIYEMQNHQILTYENKPGTLFSIPKDKIINFVPERKILFNGNTFLPIFATNQIVSQGYFSEIQTFADLCEGNKTVNKSNLSSLKNTFNLISEIKNYV